jgi:hypothetical protein
MVLAGSVQGSAIQVSSPNKAEVGPAVDKDPSQALD